MLLVGGASERFGSPKALATLDGRTLAERAWSLLEWCGERVAVGKAADALPLPFPVIDDGSALRAPIVGVRAGLATARHGVCLFLPVDCPLMTADALRALAAALAVPQTGPLPGAYPREALAEVDGRLARGELTLHGLNPHVLELDPALLANVNTPADLRRLGPP